MNNTYLIFNLLMLGVGLLILWIAVINRTNLKYIEGVLDGTKPNDVLTEEHAKVSSAKPREQLQLELVMIENNFITKYLSILDKNVTLKMMIVAVSTGFYFLISDAQLDRKALLMFAIIVFLIVTLIPSIVVSNIIASKMKKMVSELPGFIDLVAVNVQTGIQVEQALRYVSRDFKTLNLDLSYLLLRTLRRSELIGLPAALEELNLALPAAEVRMFSTVMTQSINFGSSVSNALIQLAVDLRDMQLLKIEEKLGTLSAKMSIPLIAFIMFPIIVLILAPNILRLKSAF